MQDDIHIKIKCKRTTKIRKGKTKMKDKKASKTMPSNIGKSHGSIEQVR